MNKIIALVPMKGHSERIPNKNLKLIAKKPLLYWILRTLTGSDYISEIYVDTDSSKIKNVIKSFFGQRIDFINRPSHLYGDHVAMNKIIAHDISQIKGNLFLQSHATNPFLTVKTLNKAITKYFRVVKEGYDSLFSVV